jgi:peptide/nickel transport system substrate-binding protein
VPDDLQELEYAHHLLDEVEAGRMTRAGMLRQASVMGIGAAVLGALAPVAGHLDDAEARPFAAAAPGKKGGTMRVAVTPPTAALDPLTLQDDGSFSTLQQVYEYLAWVENDGRLTPVLATSWKPSANAKTWTYKLRQGVHFSDGRALTAKDVAATFNRLADPKNKSNALAYFKGLLSAGQTEAVDDRTVRFHLDRGFGDFPYFVASANYNAFVLPANYAGDLAHPIGTGPFVMTSYRPKQGASFKRNPQYWRPGLPLLDAVEIKYYADNQPQVLALQAGGIDMMNSTPYQGSQALFSDAKITILTARSSTWRELHMRVDKEPFTDKRVRRALALTLDRGKILEALFRGKSDIGDDHLFAPSFGIPVGVPHRKQDYAKAKALLQAAGHGSGVKTTLTTENFLEIPQFVTIVKQMAAPAGIDIKLDIQDQSRYYGSGATQPWLEVPFGCVDWSARAVPSQLNDTCATCKGVWNSAKWCNPGFDALTRQYDSAVDAGSRRTIATKMAKIHQDETPMIIAYWVSVPRAMRKNVRGVGASGYNFLDLTRASFA